ncbi:MAG: phage/plasmid primase, P4 family [Candidatus Thiodiazotropha sp.]
MDELEREHDYTELGNAKRFVAISGDNYKWVPDVKQWFKWTGTKWTIDEDQSVVREIEYVLDSIKEESTPLLEQLKSLSENPDHTSSGSHAKKQYDTVKKQLRESEAWYLRSQSAKSIQAMFSLAQSQKGMTVSYTTFDSKGHYLGVENGVVDLRSGKLITGDKRYMLTKSSQYHYDPEAKCPKWEELIDTVMQGDADLQQFLQVLLGSGAVGTKSKWFMLFYGEKGGNGKSTVVDTVAALLGDYSIIGDAAILTENRSNTEYHLASLKGSRFVIFNETKKEDVNLAEHLIKMMTDSGEIVGRFPAGRPFSFQPVFTPVFCVNHLPGTSMDPAVWRRLLVVPFNHIFPKNEQNPRFVEEILKEEASGILNWIIEGAKQFIAEGLNPPKVLLESIQSAKTEVDVLSQFIGETCSEIDGERVKVNDLRTKYIRWAKDNGYRREPSARTFVRDLKDRGYEVRMSTGHQNYVFGLKLGIDPKKELKNDQSNVTNLMDLIKDRSI